VWGNLRLLSSRTDRREAAPGDPARVTLLWQVLAEEEIPPPRRGSSAPPPSERGGLGGGTPITLRLATAGGAAVFTTTAPVARTYPSTQWQPGDRLRTEILLRLPARTPDGELLWQVQLDEGTFQPIGALRIHAPDRLWTAPALDIQLQPGASLGNVATLLGASVQPQSLDIQPPTPVTVTLAWRAEAETATSYRVFLHLLGPDGKPVTQSDGEPANWTRPTTGWLPGEIVLDERVLDVPAGIPPGEYTLSCGLYELATGERAATADGTGTLHLATLRVK